MPEALAPPPHVDLPVVGGDHRHVLVADARRAVIAEVSYHLARAGFQVTTALGGADAVTTMRLREPDLVVVGDTLTGVTADEIVRRLRAAPARRDTGALMLLAPTADATARADALAIGADDCVAWPGDARELVLRAGAIVRRHARVRRHAEEVLRCGPLTIDVERADATIGGAPVRFTRTEFDLLCVLVRRPGRVLTREQLAALLWAERSRDGPADVGRRVDRHVHFIREKLGALGAWIETVPGRGYRLAPGPA